MAKKVTAQIKLQLPCGAATPSPPVGPSLAPTGINLGEFIKTFNAETASQAGLIVGVVVTVFIDRSFAMQIKSPPAAVLLKKAATLEKGSGTPNMEKVGNVTRMQVREIAETKMVDLNAASVEAAMRIIEGTARSMGIIVTG